ncbi:hypothetical protein AB6E94_19545 [Vibrio lentus]|uniref:hypothetical protein n=1 Tax=Vibrio splendidus TaxID=29497 RepID=UPI000C820839|nr:hypothetical protein [Vibrio splendidus]PMG17897.1 hypothetical protein BCU98_00765 [Vibrio splendidus]
MKSIVKTVLVSFTLFSAFVLSAPKLAEFNSATPYVQKTFGVDTVAEYIQLNKAESETLFGKHMEAAITLIVRNFSTTTFDATANAIYEGKQFLHDLDN